jgi:hypothetical protein
MLVLLSNKAMETIQKEQMTTFHKILPICDPALGLEFLQLIQVHHNMNPDLEMMIKKLQLLVSSQMSNEQKVSWLK